MVLNIQKFNMYEVLGILLISFLAAQRFTIPLISAYVCLIPFLVFLFKLYFDKNNSLLYLLLAIFFSVDNGGDIYVETSFLLRYSIYISALLVVFFEKNYNLKSILVFLGYILVLFFITIFNTEVIEKRTFIRDILLILLLGAVFCRRTVPNKLHLYRFSPELLAIALLSYLTAEVFNGYFFHQMGEGYLNYDSVKSLIVFPSLYYLCKQRYMVFTVVAVMTTYILVLYVTRMVLLCWLMVVFLYFFIHVVKLFSLKVAVGCAFLTLFGAILVQLYFSDFDFTTYKATNLFLVLFSNADVDDILRTIDPVRYVELIFFLERDFINILFGSGLGTGIVDSNNLLSFVGIYDTAFSVEELKSGFFYNFHDIWIDIGLRFGVVLLVYIFYKLLSDLFTSKEPASIELRLLLTVLIFCAFFSTSGLIMIALLAISYRYTVFSKI